MSKSAIDTGILLETGTNELEILEFYINEIRKPGEDPVPNFFGINVAKVMQVIETPNLEPPESAPHPSFMGTIPLRDLILPVLDLSVWLELDMPKTERDIVIVTEFSKSVTGFLVSGVTEIHRVGWGEVIPPSSIISTNTDAIVGLIDKGDYFVQLLDLETILSQFEPDDGVQMAVSAHEYKVLVADDSATIRAMIKSNLAEANFKPLITNNGDEALRTILNLKAKAEEEGKDITEYVDLVISDIEMPLMDGFSLTKNIKQDPVLRKLPVILYSSIITNELRHKGESVGADMQISKPDLHTIPQVALELIEGGAG
ncbi:MAG: chemotaxis protein [Pseudodesulfovibrio sp.]|jgi:two-component system chemotaxis response regulator CheV|uniref:Chemotaxis protein CheV n=1 Tax=Pseudodesulfovibrio indicus TaxID=1716143 RepID=A0A126QNR9_9BACT|nr:chemotaxis protein [Pseudodesulfovibrio indicus]AMK11386.1 chemotaxis protein CheV [Pseudodesulfovibrio indicus]TDT89776.1 two-component system chemotaxis response regulator CheV [Pseudodesulfovibrio indicus]